MTKYQNLGCLSSALAALVSSFYVFNIEYHRHSISLFQFLCVVLMDNTAVASVGTAVDAGPQLNFRGTFLDCF